MSLTFEGLEEQRSFNIEWSLSRLESLTLDEYTNLDKGTSFTYWLEKKTENSGSIWGGSAFKFGIYRRADTTKIQEYDNRETDGVYAWFRKYGSTSDEAFECIKQLIITIATSSINNQFEHIDSIDLGESIKWKIAFHYNCDALVPIFKKEVLIRASEKNGLKEAKKTNTSQLQKFLISLKSEDENTLTYANRLWNHFNIENIYEVINKFLKQANTNNLKRVNYPKAYHGFTVKISFGAGVVARIPWIAFLKEPNKVTSGIYPVFLYYKEIDTLILAYGVSETKTSDIQWENLETSETVNQYYNRIYNRRPDRYGDSYVKNIYKLHEEIDANQLQQNLDEILEEYRLQLDDLVESPQ